MNIDQKINRLLKDSKVDYLLGLDDSESIIKKSLRIRLKRIVQILFELELCTESEWNNDEKTVISLQKNLHRAIKGLYIKTSLLDKYVSNVIKQLKLEKQLADQKFPESLDLNLFYYYKSSRLKLIRSIIYNKVECLAERSSSEWANFDLLRAIRNDLDGIKEDAYQLNSNRFLVSLANKGQDQTINDYIVFVQQKLAVNSVTSQEPMAQQLSLWIHQEAQKILNILQDFKTNNEMNSHKSPPDEYQIESSLITQTSND